MKESSLALFAIRKILRAHSEFALCTAPYDIILRPVGQWIHTFSWCPVLVAGCDTVGYRRYYAGEAKVKSAGWNASQGAERQNGNKGFGL